MNFKVLAYIVVLCSLVHGTLGRARRSGGQKYNPFADPRAEKIIYDNQSKGFKVAIERGQMNHTTLRSAKVVEGIEPPKLNQSLWNKITGWFEKENEDFTNEVKSFFGSFQFPGLEPQFLKKASLKDIKKHPIVQGNMKINLNNRLNTMYYGPLYVGSPGQEVQVIYDTGSDWLVVESKYCRTCLKNSYDHLESQTWVNASSGIKE